MIKKEALEGMTAEQVMQLLQEVKERRRVAVERANNAIHGYEKAVAVRDAKIKELRDDLNKQLADIADRAGALNAAMLKASLAGDDMAFDKAQLALAELERPRSQLNARLELLNGKPPRCDEAYDAMNTAVAEGKKADEQFSEEVAAIREFCEEAMRPWTEIVSSLRTYGGVEGFSLDRARSHYSSEH